MSDLEFETRLDRLFAEPPYFEDAEGFARKVESRLERGWSIRRLFIGAAGVVAGLFGASQLMGAGIFLKAAGVEASEQASMAGKVWHQVVSASSNMGALPVSPEVLWMTAALGVTALGFAITRATQEF
ncbi:MAG: hypothetical protein GC145_08220 [Caulobacter sp.]|nr:hypothetical protein [Caulobacter sp.]